MSQIRVAIVDDSDVFRVALQRSLARFSDIRLVIEACEAAELTARLAVEPVDVALVDVRMPSMGGAELTRFLRDAYPQVAPIALTVSDSRDDLVELLRSGSRGYILKTASPVDIADAIRAVARGEAWVATSMARTLIDEFSHLQTLSPRRGVGAEAHLSEREDMVLRELALGRTNREIAERLHIAESTVKSHLKSILEKLGVRNRVEAVLYASRRDHVTGE
jgi:DNA-binding NarL/FixJ family response regulator